MKTKLLLIPTCAFFLFFVSCEEQQSTIVSKSLWGDDTIVSRSNSNGTFTRTEYGSDFALATVSEFLRMSLVFRRVSHGIKPGCLKERIENQSTASFTPQSSGEN